MKEERLKQLKKSLEYGLITNEEYEEKKKEIEEIQEDPTEGKHPAEEAPPAGLKSDKILMIGLALVIIAFAAVFGWRYFAEDETPQTIDDLHKLNFKGKLKEDQGYLYKGAYSFVKFDGSWYTQLVSPKGTRLYNIQFRYGPKEVENVETTGKLDIQAFDNATEYYATFNPTGNDFSSVALAVSDFNQQMTKIFFKQPIAACDRNETTACIGRPVITCGNTDKLVLYVKESNNSIVRYGDNCITIEGNGFDLVRGVDRVLYEFYGIIKE